MRTLLLLRGAPGAGKTTFIQQHHLEQYTLQADRFRQLVANPVLQADGSLSADRSLDNAAWNMLYSALEIRMRRGDFTIIDATHSSIKMLNKYKRLAERYRYRVFAFTLNPPLPQVLEQNRSRLAQVPEVAVRRSYNTIQNTPLPRFITPINSVGEIMHYHTEDVSHYSRVVVIGDVQGCFTALKTALGDLDPDTLYVFSGDLLDRGLENVSVFQWALDHVSDPNVIFVEGNHDTHLAEYGYNNWPADKRGNPRIPTQFQQTLRELLAEYDEETLRKHMRILARAFRQAFLFTFHGNKYMVTHGGLPCVPSELTTIATRTLIHGSGDYSTPIDQMYEADYHGVTQIHGHRHSETTPHSICLENGVEYGGQLMVCTIDERGLTVSGVTNLVSAKPPQPTGVAGVQLTANEITNQLITSPYVKAKLQPHHAISLNFTERAFKKKAWNSQTIRARGLFVDQTTGDVLMRSYNKFFNVGERPETALDKLNYPLTAYKKENGFLGLMSVIDGEVVLASKTTMSGPAQALLTDLWGQLSSRQQQEMALLAEQEGCTFVFEVIHHADRHIIDYPTDRLVLLDAVRNSYDLATCVNPDFSAEVCSHVPLGGVLMGKQIESVFYSPADVKQYQTLHHADRTLEGVVLEDIQGNLSKLKLPYYLTVKRLRGALSTLQRTYPTVDKSKLSDPKVRAFVEFFLQQPYETWKGKHILDALAEYERACGPIM